MIGPAEPSKEVYGSKRAVFPMMMIVVNLKRGRYGELTIKIKLRRITKLQFRI
jgi:hypothetical protein